MHPMESLKQLFTESAQQDLSVSEDGPPLDLHNGYYILDIWRDEKHVALCLWNVENGFALDILPTDPKDIGLDNPIYAPPYYATVEEAFKAIFERCMAP